MGNSLEQVRAQCGKPDTEKTYKIPPDPYAEPQEWIYVIKAYSAEPQNGMRLSILFQDKKATNITINGTGRGQTEICNDIPIQTGDTMDAIKKACGGPQMINKNQSSIPPQETEVTELSYTNTPTPMTLIFENGVLTKKK